jgi:hypothetical protein
LWICEIRRRDGWASSVNGEKRRSYSEGIDKRGNETAERRRVWSIVNGRQLILRRTAKGNSDSLGESYDASNSIYFIKVEHSNLT